ncbi:type II toxin-antitoxin system HicB family antitoxin [candidate division WOR-3 bacterium]|nr:type II toxin-antitoxin system HicB family antitoxin [candidate division WOR-3 bacterium]
MERTFTLEYWQDDGWYTGRLKEVPGVFSQGETMAELEDNIRDAYKMMMETEVLPKLSMKPQEKEVHIKNRRFL